MKRKLSDPVKRAAFRDAYELLTDDHLKAALLRRKELLQGRLADLAVNEMLTEEWQPKEREQHDHEKALYEKALADIEKRLNGAAALLRPFSKNGHTEE